MPPMLQIGKTIRRGAILGITAWFNMRLASVLNIFMIINHFLNSLCSRHCRCRHCPHCPLQQLMIPLALVWMQQDFPALVSCPQTSSLPILPLLSLVHTPLSLSPIPLSWWNHNFLSSCFSFHLVNTSPLSSCDCTLAAFLCSSFLWCASNSTTLS